MHADRRERCARSQGLKHHAAAYVDAYVADTTLVGVGEEDDVARLEAGFIDEGAVALAVLARRAVGQVEAILSVDVFGEAAAVEGARS